MERVRIAPEYDATWLEIERPQPLCDQYLESLFEGVFKSKPLDHSISMHDKFKELASSWILESKLNNLKGLDSFKHIDLMSGCTQFIDNIYMKGPVQTIKGDYKYHERLGHSLQVEPGNLKPNTPLILALPFPTLASIHPNTEEILNECMEKNIEVHIDGAWISCSRFIDFNFAMPAVVSVGISLSKGLGLGWNRIGLRWSKHRDNDSITIMNDFHMQNRALTIVGNHVLSNVQPDYLWNRYSAINDKVCKDFNLKPTNAIHMAKDSSGRLVGLSPLMRYLINE